MVQCDQREMMRTLIDTWRTVASPRRRQRTTVLVIETVGPTPANITSLMYLGNAVCCPIPNARVHIPMHRVLSCSSTAWRTRSERGSG